MLDGKLRARERARFIKHLRGCESCRENYLGALHIRNDLRRDEQLEAARSPRPFERPREEGALRPRVWWAAAALAAVLAATAGLVVFLQGGRGAGPSTEQLASLVGPVAPLQVPWGKRMRGGSGQEEPPELTGDHEAFQLGVRFLDLRLALASGNQVDADEALRRLHVLLTRGSLPVPQLTAVYDEMWNKVRQGVPPPALLPTAATAEKKAMQELQEDPRLVELGRWTEACRLAVENGRAGLFHEPATLRVLDEAMRPGGKDADNLDPEALKIVRTIREDIAGGRIDSAALREPCTKLLDHLASDYE